MRNLTLKSPRLFNLTTFVLAFASTAAVAQTQDNSGNGMLQGTFAFRHVAVQNIDDNFNPTQVTASYGSIVFDGNGNYTITGSTVDNTVSGGSPQALNVSGTYAIGSNGTGYVANPLYSSDPNAYVYGAVAQGVFAGSSTEVGDEERLLNDIFVAIPVSASVTNAAFASAYQTGLLDFAGGVSSAIKNALFELTPNGKGGFGTISLSGQASDSFLSTVSQSVSGATYSFNGNSATLSIPLASGTTSATAMFTGTKTLYLSADGNFILGWTPTGYDIFFGVKALAVTGTNSISQGLYFNAALEDSPDGNGTDSYYGSINNSGDSNGDGIVHARLNFPFSFSFDYGTNDLITIDPSGSTPEDLDGYEYLFGDGGQAYVGIGTNGLYSLQIGLHAPSFTGSGVFIDPVGIFNAGSLAPITESLSPGELLVIAGSNLATTSQSMKGGQSFPLELGGVSATVNNIPCPIYFVSPTLISIAVPYELATNQTGLANIQVTSNNVASNVVQMYFDDSAPGAFSQGANGIGLAAATHAATGELITASNPAVGGETIALYLTGMGTVTPAITDGAVGPSSPLSYSDLFNAGNLTVYFNDYENGTAGNLGTVAFAGLTPTLAGLYQINVTVPTSGLVAGDDVYVEFITDMADVDQIEIPYGSSGGGGRRVQPVKPFNRSTLVVEERAAKSSGAAAVPQRQHASRRGRLAN